MDKISTFSHSSITCLRVCMLATVLLVALGGGAQGADSVTVQLALDGSSLEGTPVAWNSSQVLLLARNGFLLQFPPNKAEDFRQISPRFHPWSQSEMRGQLQREFGRRFQVSGTGNYLVVHPAGQKDRWAQRFENLYRSFTHYFSVRGMRPASPQFPLVAVVFHSQNEFLQYGRQAGGSLSPGVLGYYSPRTNRVILYDITHGESTDENWHINAGTIIHEATHQMAFNTRIHSRTALPPRWAAEGLAMLFEAPGVWDARHYPHQGDRINRSRLKSFRQYAQHRKAGSLPLFVSQTNRGFAQNPGASYAEAWALSFFLSEKEPAKYMKYLAKTAAREPLKTYSSAEQLQEFTGVFGRDLKMLEVRYLRFIAQIND